LLKLQWNFYFTSLASEPLILSSLIYVLLFLTAIRPRSQVCLQTATETEICMHAGQVGFERLSFIFVSKYFLQSNSYATEQKI
jgi:hypothetical protein